jgi:hypothetical protein
MRRPSARSASPSITTSWHGASFTATGGIGSAIARIQASPISLTGWPIPMA